MYGMLKASFPDHEWEGWKFVAVDDGYWKSLDHQRQFLGFVSRQENFTSLEGWYGITNKRVIELGGGSLLKEFRNSIATMVQTVYPNHPWLPWKFTMAPKGYWSQIENRQRFFTWIAETLHLDPTKLDSFYSLKPAQVITAAGTRGLLEKHDGSLSKALMAAFPEHEWKEWKFVQVPKNFWLDRRNVRKFCDDLLLSKSFRRDQKHQITDDDIRNHGGRLLLERIYDGSKERIFADAYPEDVINSGTD